MENQEVLEAGDSFDGGAGDNTFALRPGFTLPAGVLLTSNEHLILLGSTLEQMHQSLNRL